MLTGHLVPSRHGISSPWDEMPSSKHYSLYKGVKPDLYTRDEAIQDNKSVK